MTDQNKVHTAFMKGLGFKGSDKGLDISRKNLPDESKGITPSKGFLGFIAGAAALPQFRLQAGMCLVRCRGHVHKNNLVNVGPFRNSTQNYSNSFSKPGSCDCSRGRLLWKAFFAPPPPPQKKINQSFFIHFLDLLGLRHTTPGKH